MNIIEVVTINHTEISASAPLRSTLGENVLRLRTEQELSKKTFSIMSGISRPLLNEIESGDSDIRLSYVQRLADALCVEPIELLTLPEKR